MPKSPDEVTLELRAQPGIDVCRLKVGTRITVETTQTVFELEMTVPSSGILRIFGTDPRLRSGVSGRLLQSNYDKDGLVNIPYWIGKSLRMQFVFKNGIFSCTPALSARVIGDNWFYEVF